MKKQKKINKVKNQRNVVAVVKSARKGVTNRVTNQKYFSKDSLFYHADGKQN